jgi:hypothetical protein
MKSIKWCTIFAVMFLAAYPVVELTRYIIKYNLIQGRGTPAPSYLELAMMWGFFICIPFVLNVAFEIYRRKPVVK